MENWREEIAEIRAIMKETARKQEEYEAKRQKEVAEINKMIGGMANSNGLVAEESFYNALESSKTLGKIHFDHVGRNWKGEIVTDGKIELEGEYDIVMVNKNAICIVETKYKVKKEDVAKLADKMLDAFKTLYPRYADYKYYLAVGGLSFEKGAESQAKELGIAILKVKGEKVEIIDSNLKVY